MILHARYLKGEGREGVQDTNLSATLNGAGALALGLCTSTSAALAYACRDGCRLPGGAAFAQRWIETGALRAGSMLYLATRSTGLVGMYSLKSPPSLELECTLVAAECLLTHAAPHAIQCLEFAKAAADGLEATAAALCCALADVSCKHKGKQYAWAADAAGNILALCMQHADTVVLQAMTGDVAALVNLLQLSTSALVFGRLEGGVSESCSGSTLLLIGCAL